MNKRGCFGFQIKKCFGACVGQEETKFHDERLVAGLDELKIHIWPYDGEIELVEQREDWIQKHRINQWRYLGTWCSRDSSFHACSENGLDLDTYKILIRILIFNPDHNNIKKI